MPDRVEASESLVIAAICLLRGGRFADAREAGRAAIASARDLSPHRRLHAASAMTTCLLGAGRLAELAEATADTPELVEHEGSRTCAMASLALAGHAVVRFEMLDTAAGELAASSVEAVGLHRSDSSFRYRGIEILGRSSGSSARARGSTTASRSAAWSTASTTCARACSSPRSRRRRPRAADRQGAPVAREACAPPLALIADWAEALRAGSLAGATAATDALDAYGERYTAARLMVDALMRMPARSMAAGTAARLRAMGALASAAELSAVPSGSRAG